MVESDIATVLRQGIYNNNNKKKKKGFVEMIVVVVVVVVVVVFVFVLVVVVVVYVDVVVVCFVTVEQDSYWILCFWCVDDSIIVGFLVWKVVDGTSHNNNTQRE